MKRVKMMLLSLLVLAVAGGALAFKAKFEQNYCTAATVLVGEQFTCPATLTCPNLTIQKSSIGGNEGFICIAPTAPRFDVDAQTFVCEDITGVDFNCGVISTSLRNDQ